MLNPNRSSNKLTHLPWRTEISASKPLFPVLVDGKYYTQSQLVSDKLQKRAVSHWRELFARSICTNSSCGSLCQMQFAQTACKWSQFSTNILHTDSGRSEVVSKIETIRWPEQCTLLDFRNFTMHTFTNRCSSASNSLIKFRRSPYLSFRVGLCL